LKIKEAEVKEASGGKEQESCPNRTFEKTVCELPRIYIGPSIKGVSTGTVFKGDLSPMLNEAIGDLPAIKELVIPTSEIVTANKLLNDPNTALSRFFEMAKNYKKENKANEL
jgi:hypothetical protein